MNSLLKYGAFLLFILSCSRIFSQSQTCPANINFSFRDLTHWYAYTGNNGTGNGTGSNGASAIKQQYDSLQPAPIGTIGAVAIPEYQLPFVNGISMVNAPGTDRFGGFATIPVINGYAYGQSVLLGSTSILNGRGNDGGGYIRGISYSIFVPPGPATEPYTITYAYAMVLENGSHTTVNQPMFTATVATADSVLRCASASYNLPTQFVGVRVRQNRIDSIFLMDESIARAQGFRLSPVPSPNADNNGNEGEDPYRVWTKGWTEVTFDLSAYRGRRVSLTFEADNCIPGGHFSYAYIALRNVCEGLTISGDLTACTNTPAMYSIPTLAGATYNWQVPPGWTIVSGDDSNILTVIPGSVGGEIIAQEVNSCANLRDTIDVTVIPPSLGGSVNSDNRVCEGLNLSPLSLTGYRGNILNWIVSADNGISWNVVPGTTGAISYNAQDLDSTTTYRALVQNGNSCSIDTSRAAIIRVDPTTRGGRLTPVSMEFCLGQDTDATLTLQDERGDVQYWQFSLDGINWTNVTPSPDQRYDIPSSTTQSTQYRSIVQSGVCPSDTSEVAGINIINVLYPQQTISPQDTLICYGDTARLRSVVTAGTDYRWMNNTNTLTGLPAGTIPSLPFTIENKAFPLTTTRYRLRIMNEGCPTPRTDTFLVQVLGPVLINAGRDTAIVYNQPLQLQVTSNYTNTLYNWTPATGLNDPTIFNPIATLGSTVDSIRYTVRVTEQTAGCYATDDILVRVFKTLPDIFVPNAFTPGRGSNRLFRPVPVGIFSLDYFRVYNRWGQLVYSTTRMGEGWDGTINGVVQSSGSFVWMVQGKDYTGKTITHKGTMVLIR